MLFWLENTSLSQTLQKTKLCLFGVIAWKGLTLWEGGGIAPLNFSLCTIWSCRSQWPRGLRRRSSAARLLRLGVRIRAEVSYALRTGRRCVSGLHCDWWWNMGFSLHSWIQATVTAMAPYAFPKNQKFKTSISVKKIMASVLWDRKDILLVNFMPPGSTINAAAYCDTLTRLRWPIQNQKRGMLPRGVCPLHDKARPHSAHVTTALLEKFKCDILDHPPYGPDLAPSDFHLFLHLKKQLAGKKFDDDDEVQEVMTRFKGQAADFSDSGIQKLVPRLNKCLDNAGDYVAK